MKPIINANINIEYSADCSICGYYAMGGGNTTDSFITMKYDIEQHYKEEHNIEINIGERKSFAFEKRNSGWTE